MGQAQVYDRGRDTQIAESKNVEGRKSRAKNIKRQPLTSEHKSFLSNIMRMTLLLISGSLRAGSANTAALRTIEAIAPSEVSVVLYGGLETLPHFNPDLDHEPLHPAVVELRSSIAASDAVLFSTPEYAGALPGSFKNVLDWTVGGGELYEKPVTWVNVSSIASPTGGADAHDSLRKILGYTGSRIVEAACVRIPIDRKLVGSDGLIADLEIRQQLLEGLEALKKYLSSQ